MSSNNQNLTEQQRLEQAYLNFADNVIKQSANSKPSSTGELVQSIEELKHLITYVQNKLNKPKYITSPEDCKAAGGMYYNYCPVTNTHYCCGPSNKEYQSCNTDKRCSTNAGLLHCACPNQLNDVYDKYSQEEYAKILNDATNELSVKREQLMNSLKESHHEIETQQSELNNLREEIKNKELRAKQQEYTIKNKETLINTRNRMLQISQEKNVYRKKVIYTLLALIVFVILIILISLTFFKK